MVDNRVTLTGKTMCGYCRNDINRTLFYNGMRVDCPGCGRSLWFEVVDGRVIQHPGKPVQE